nr:MAG TPA: 43 kDa tail protein [Caudoviricetes sp.]
MIELIIQNSGNGNIYDVSDVVSDLNQEETINGSPGKLSFKLKSDEVLKIENGSIVRFKHNGKDKFYGYVFKISHPNEYQIEVTAYDQLRYLKNKDTYVFGNGTLEERIAKICYDFGLKIGNLDSTYFLLPAKIFDNKSLGDIIQESANGVLIGTTKRYVIKDNFGKIELYDLEKLKTNIVITEGSLLVNQKYEESIDSDTYNQIKLVKENKKTKKREVYISKDSNNIYKYGMLQMYEKVDENSNEEQIKEKADRYLRLKNSPTRKLSLEVLGNENIVAGCGLYVDLTISSKEKIQQYVLVKSVKTKYEENHFSMSLEVEVE